MSEVTDPTILKQLEKGGVETKGGLIEITDPVLIEKLETVSTPQTSPSSKPSLSLGQKFRQAIQPPKSYSNMPTWQKILTFPQAIPETILGAVTGMGANTIATVEDRKAQAIGLTPEQRQSRTQAIQGMAFQPENPLAQWALNVMSAPFSMATEGAGEISPLAKQALEDALAAVPFKGVIPKQPVGKTSPLTMKQANMAQVADKYNMPVSPSSIKPSLPAKAAEAIGDLPVISWAKNKYQKQVNDIVTAKIEEVRNKYAPSEEIEGFTQGVSDAYSNALNNLQVDRVPMNKFFELLDKFSNAKTLSKEAKRLYEAWKIEAGEEGTLSTETLGEIKRQINTIVGKKARDSKKKLLDTLLEDIAEAPGGDLARDALKEVDKQYLYYSKSRQIQNLLNSSVTYNAGKFVEPQKFLDSYGKQREGLKRYAPEAVKELDEVATIMEVAKKDLEGFKKYQTESPLLRNLVGMGGTIGSMFRPEVAGGLAGGLMLTKSTMNPKGIAKNMLLRGKGDMQGFTDPYKGWGDFAKAQEKENQPPPVPPSTPTPVPNTGWDIRDTVRGSHNGQIDGTLIAENKTGGLGKLDYAQVGDKILIQNIEVPKVNQRNGIATSLVTKLKEENPNATIEWGMLTDEGAKFKTSLTPQAKATKGTSIAPPKAQVLGDWDQYPLYNFLWDRYPDQARKILNGLKTDTDFEGGAGTAKSSELSKAMSQITQAYNEYTGFTGTPSEFIKGDIVEGLKREINYAKDHPKQPSNVTMKFNKEDLVGFIDEDTGMEITPEYLTQQFQGKPYTGIEPGTSEWKSLWKEHPELQNEMLDYKQKSGFAAMIVTYGLLDGDGKSKMLAILKKQFNKPSLSLKKKK